MEKTKETLSRTLRARPLPQAGEVTREARCMSTRREQVSRRMMQTHLLARRAWREPQVLLA